MNPGLRCWNGDNLKEIALKSNNPGTLNSTHSCRSASLKELTPEWLILLWVTLMTTV